MENALGLSGGQTTMIAITIAMLIMGLGGLFAAVFLPKRWRMKYRMEIGFVALLAALMFYADRQSTGIFSAYQEDFKAEQTVSGKVVENSDSKFDRTLRVLAFQWGFAFITKDNKISRNAAIVSPGERVLFKIVSNDVIHGFNIPVARITSEIDPSEVSLVWIRAPEKPGKYLIQCVNYCGIGHAQMKAWLVVDGDVPTAKLKTGGTRHGA